MANRTFPAIYFDKRLSMFQQSTVRHPIAQEYFTGKSIKLDGVELDANFRFTLPHPLPRISTLQLAYLFSIFNNSRVHVQAQYAYGPDADPPALYFTVINKRILYAKNRSGIFNEEIQGSALFIQGLHIDHFFLRKDMRRKKIATIAIALCALASYKLGLSAITLVAAGGRDYNPRHKGYAIWPKFGFDSDLLPGEIEGLPHLRLCKTVLDTLALDEKWWELNGSQRLMIFDLSPYSRSWEKLITYVTENVLEEVKNGN